MVMALRSYASYSLHLYCLHWYCIYKRWSSTLWPIYWNPSDYMQSGPNRARQFFAAFGYALAVLGVNISASSVSAANDLSALFPSFVNLRRGQMICAGALEDPCFSQ